MSVHQEAPDFGNQPLRVCVPEFKRFGEVEMNTAEELAVRELTLGRTEEDIYAVQAPSELRHIGSNGAPRVDMRLAFIDSGQTQALGQRVGLHGQPGYALFDRFTSLVESSTEPGKQHLPMALYESPESGLPACNVATVHQLADAYASRPRYADGNFSLSEEEMLITVVRWLPLPNATAASRTRFADYRVYNDVLTGHVSEQHFWELSSKLGYKPRQSPRLYERLFMAVGDRINADRANGYHHNNRFNQLTMRQRGIPLNILLRAVDLLPPLQQRPVGASVQATDFRFDEKYHLVKYAAKMRPYEQGAQLHV